MQNGLGGRPLPSRIRESICKKYLAVFLRENEDKPRDLIHGLILEILRQMAVSLAWKRGRAAASQIAQTRFVFKVCVDKVFVEIKSIQEKGAWWRKRPQDQRNYLILLYNKCFLHRQKYDYGIQFDV